MIQFADIYNNKKVLVTGHTGFKGSWLCLWLKKMGAHVTGYALQPETVPNHFNLLNLDISSVIGDIRDFKKVKEVFETVKPEIVFHLAAQPLVRRSYRDPRETYETNIMGTVNVYEAARQSDSVRAIVCVTSDKVYENREWLWGYRENDPVGGYDPYSSSKGCAEIITSSYRNSFFNQEQSSRKNSLLLASARAGNVIGGGDWAEDRLVPDIMRATARNETVTIRNPVSTRPWQHVLEPLSGYLFVGQKLLEGQSSFAEAWNFGPMEEGAISVENVVERINKNWDRVSYVLSENISSSHEANYLKIDCSKAHIKLKWLPVWDSKKAFAVTTEWYREFYTQSSLLSEKQLDSYIETAKDAQACWVI
jgi:CDP-glucose 4,6-dehydratase